MTIPPKDGFGALSFFSTADDEEDAAFAQAGGPEPLAGLDAAVVGADEVLALELPLGALPKLLDPLRPNTRPLESGSGSLVNILAMSFSLLPLRTGAGEPPPLLPLLAVGTFVVRVGATVLVTLLLLALLLAPMPPVRDPILSRRDLDTDPTAIELVDPPDACFSNEPPKEPKRPKLPRFALSSCDAWCRSVAKQ